jgi:ribosomal protein S18 acetylase RimI-like enzyme
VVADAVSQSQSAFRGARPFDHRTDLYAVAHLLEEAFRPEHHFLFSGTPLLRELGVFLWTLNYAPMLPETISGFVWVEEGQVVGNITLNFDKGREDHYHISNVAVKPAYWRQGIARALMQATLDHLRTLHVKSVLLNVRPSNPGAIKLYEDLGFKTLEMRGEWTSPLAPQPPLSSPDAVHQGRGEGATGEWGEANPREVSELIRAAAPAKVLSYRPRQSEFELNWDERIFRMIADLFTLQSTRRWTLQRDGRLAAVMMVRGQRIFSPHRIAIQVHPDFRGGLEDRLVEVALQHLALFPRREIRVEVADTHPELVAALERHGFKFLNGLTLMELEL